MQFLLHNRTKMSSGVLLLHRVVSHRHAFTLEITHQLHFRYALDTQTVLAEFLNLVEIDRFHAQNGRVHRSRRFEKGREFRVERALVFTVVFFPCRRFPTY